MFYYIYYIYFGGYIVYKIYEYTHLLRYGYKTVYYTYNLTRVIYNMLPCKENLENLNDWECIDIK
jgi:hypothetical protein